MEKITARYDPGTAFSIIHGKRYIWWDFDRGSDRGWTLLRVFKPYCECTKAFFQIRTHIADFQLLSIGWKNLPH